MGLLSSLKILDFSALLPGPFATLTLADLGADVVHVESPDRPDLMRFYPPVKDGRSAAHAHLNRSKRSLGIDLKSDDGKEIIRRMVKDYDIILEQFRPGVMDRLGLGYADLKAVNPGLIYCAVSGYGQTGPFRDRAGHDINYLSVAGVISYNGRKSTGPGPMNLQVADIAGGSYHAVMAILAAVIHRQQTGKGQYIDVSLTDAAFSMQATTLANAIEAGIDPDLEGDIFNGGTFYDCYETRDGKYISIASIEPGFFSSLCEILGFPELAVHALSPDPEIQAMVKDKISSAIKSKSSGHWEKVFAAADCCAEPVYTLTQALDHPQIQARELIVDVPEGKGIRRQAGFPVKFSDFEPSYKFTGADIGAHTLEVLPETGFAPDKIQELLRDGVIFSANADEGDIS
ncbi:MAG: CoA transferase [Desulfobacterales bacterium]|nr:CoA transferase [Desulfobacterales bacterium]